MSEYLKQIASALPSDIILNSVEYSGKTLTISALSPNELNIQQYLVNLQSLDAFSNASIQKIAPAPDNESLLSFTITAYLNKTQNK